MPPRPPNSSHFPVTDPDNEVVCPIKQADGTGCRKRCLGEKRFRSMQEHIRRAHPEYYIPKLPATKESFDMMVNSPPHHHPAQSDAWSPPSERREQHYLPPNNSHMYNGFDFDNAFDEGAVQLSNNMRDAYYPNDLSAFDIPTSTADFRRGSLIPAANAAAALAQLHYARPDGVDWEGDQNFFTDHVTDEKRAHFDDPTLSAEQQFLDDQYPVTSSEDASTLLPSSMDKSPPTRSNTLPPIPRSVSRSSRQRKSSVSQNSRKAKHERQKSKDHLRPFAHDRKALSAEPGQINLYGKRWEDLIDAATSATEEDCRDLTPIPASPFHSPQGHSRTSLPPFALGSQFQSYTASPLQQTLTPPPADNSTGIDLQPFPSVEEPSSIDSTQSGANFHIMPSHQALSSASDSSPMFSTPVQIYCAGCRRLSALKDSYACPECICGLCPGCVDALISEQGRGRVAQCPRCRTMGGRFKPFQLDIR